MPVDAAAIFWLAAKWVISYATGTPRRLKAGEVARLADKPKRYSVFNSRPSKVRVIRSFRRIKSGASRGCRDVLARCEMGDFVRDGNTHEAEAGGSCHKFDFQIATSWRTRCFSGITGKANRPKRYSVFNSRPSKVRVMSTRPWTFSANRDELIDFA